MAMLYELVATNGMTRGGTARMILSRKQLEEMMLEALWHGVLASEQIEGAAISEVERDRSKDVSVPMALIDNIVQKI